MAVLGPGHILLIYILMQYWACEGRVVQKEVGLQVNTVRVRQILILSVNATIITYNKFSEPYVIGDDKPLQLAHRSAVGVRAVLAKHQVPP